jgi:hypothetical protein
MTIDPAIANELALLSLPRLWQYHDMVMALHLTTNIINSQLHCAFMNDFELIR